MIAKNTIYLLLSGQISKLLNFFQVTLLIRYLGKDNYGIWSITQSIPGIFYMLTDMGLGSIMLRTITRNKESLNETISLVIVLKIFLVIPYLLSIYLFTEINHYEQFTKVLIYLSTISFLFSCINDTFLPVFRACENFAFESILSSINSIGLLISLLIVIAISLKLKALMVGLIIINILTTVICCFIYKKYFGKIRISIESLGIYWKQLIKASPFAVLSLINPIFFQIDILMLSKLSTYASVAIYNAPYRIILFLFVVPDALRKTIFPRFSSLYFKSQEDFKKLFHYICRIIILLAFPISAGLFLLSNKITNLLFTREFSASADPLRIMAICTGIYFIRNIFSVTLYSANYEKIAVLILALATVLNGLLDLFLIPRFDYTGAALASLIAEFAIFIGYFVIVRFKFFKITFLKTTIKICISTAFMVLSLKLSNSINLFIQIAIGFVVYAACILLLKAINKEDLEYIFKMTRGTHFSKLNQKEIAIVKK